MSVAIKLTLSDSTAAALEKEAADMGISVQELIRARIDGEMRPSLTPEKICRKALDSLPPSAEFTLQSLLKDDADYAALSRAEKGVLGRSFYMYVKTVCQGKLEFLRPGGGGAPATYRIYEGKPM